MPIRRVVALAAFASLWGAPGCGALERVRECEAVIEAVSSGLSELHVQIPDAGASASAYTRIAETYDALSQRLAGLQPRDAALAKALDTYREVAERAAARSRSYSEALSRRARTKKERTEKETRLTRIRSQAQAELSREAQAVRKLNAVCHPQ